MSRKNDVGFASHIDEDIKKQQNFDKHKDKYGSFTNYCKRYDPKSNKCIGYGGYCNSHRKAHCEHYSELSDAEVQTLVTTATHTIKKTKRKTITQSKKKKAKLTNCLTIIHLTVPITIFEDILDYTWNNKICYYTTEFDFDQIDRINCNNYRIRLKCGKRKRYYHSGIKSRRQQTCSFPY